MRNFRSLQNDINKNFSLEIIRELYAMNGVEKTQVVEAFTEDWLSLLTDDFNFINLDRDHFVIYDDYLTQLFAAKGLTSLNATQDFCTPKGKLVASYPLSFFHHIDIFSDSTKNEELLALKVDAKLKGLVIDINSQAFYQNARSVFFQF